MSKFADLPPLRRSGLERMEQVYGFDMQDSDEPFFEATSDHLFAGIWNRPGLSDRDRRLMLIGMLSSSAGLDLLTIQVRAAYANKEFDEAALREIVLFVAHYAGWPNGARLHRVVEDALAGKEPSATIKAPVARSEKSA